MRSLPAAALSILCSLAAAMPPRPLAAQTASTCGWSFLQPREVPPTLERLRSRAPQEVPDWLPGAESNLLSWYRECDETAGREAVHSLQAAQSRTNSSDPLLLAWWGVALVRGPEVQVPHAEGAFLRSTHISSNSERDGARLLARVAEETAWPEVIEELAAVAVATRKDETLELASRTLWNVLDARDEPALWSELAEVELVRANDDAAERASGRAIAASEPRGLRVAGLLRMRAGDDAEGAELYLRGLDAATAESDLQPYFDDLRLLLSRDERAQWNTVGTGRAEWIRRKWEWRAQMAGVRLEERLGVNEHRLVEALTRYNRLSFRGFRGMNPVWTSDSVWLNPLDDRGIVFLRHGDPDVVVDDPVLPGSRRGERVAWIYHGPASNSVALEFDRLASDYILSEPSPCYAYRSLAPDPARRRPPGPPSDYATSLATQVPSLGWYYIRCEWRPEYGILAYSDTRAEARRSAETTWTSESRIIRFEQPLKSAWNLYAFQSGSGPELVSYLAIETADAEPVAPETTRLDFDLLLSVGDPVTETTTQLDTTLSYASSTPIPRNAVLQWALPIRPPANDNARVTLTVRNRADAAQGRVAATTWRIPAFDGSLLLSDIVVAQARDGVLRRGTHQITPALGHAIRQDTPFRLYYELYGARPGDPLSVTVQVLPAKAEGIVARLQELISSREAFSVEFEEYAVTDAYGFVRIERDYQAELEPGAYSVVVTIRDGRTDETVSMDTNLVVVER